VEPTHWACPSTHAGDDPLADPEELPLELAPVLLPLASPALPPLLAPALAPLTTPEAVPLPASVVTTLAVPAPLPMLVLVPVAAPELVPLPVPPVLVPLAVPKPEPLAGLPPLAVPLLAPLPLLRPELLPAPASPFGPGRSPMPKIELQPAKAAPITTATTRADKVLRTVFLETSQESHPSQARSNAGGHSHLSGLRRRILGSGEIQRESRAHKRSPGDECDGGGCAHSARVAPFLLRMIIGTAT
jgi:hypothetical protein